jgi:hypothetical protein
MPAEAGIQQAVYLRFLDTGLRRCDELFFRELLTTDRKELYP